MSTLQLRSPYIPSFSVLLASARVVAIIVAVVDVFAEAQDMARAAQKRYPFTDWWAEACCVYRKPYPYWLAEGIANNCQHIANESPEPNANKRRQSSSDLSGFTGVSRERDPLITVWLEVRVVLSLPKSHRKLGSRATTDRREVCQTKKYSLCSNGTFTVRQNGKLLGVKRFSLIPRERQWFQ